MNKEKIFSVIAENVREILQLSEIKISLEDDFVSLGANSMDRSDIIMMSLEQLAIEIPLIDVVGLSTIGEMVDYLNDHV